MNLFETRATSCPVVRRSFSSYLDGAVNGREMQSIAAHLKTCVACAGEFAGWQVMQQTLSSLRTTRAPENLSLRLRLAISREQSARRAGWGEALGVIWENTLRPVALQTAAGLACAVALIGTIGLLLGFVPPPNAVLANDEPLGAITAPHYLYSVVRPSPIVYSGPASSTIVVEAQINSEGRVFDYTMVSAPQGPDAAAIDAQIVDQLLLSVFKPASVFGAPVKGRVILTFAEVSVHA